jgi:hypothetical protein
MSKIKISSNLFFLLALFFFGVNSANAAFCDLWFDPTAVNIGETSNLHWSITGDISSASIGCDGDIVNIEPVDVTEALQNESVGSISWVAGAKAGYVQCDLDIEPAQYGGCSTGDHGQNLNVNSSTQPPVSPPAADPDIECSFEDNRIIEGGKTTLSWNATNAYVVGVECSGLYPLGTTTVASNGSSELTMPKAGWEKCIFTAYNSERKTDICEAYLDIDSATPGAVATVSPSVSRASVMPGEIVYITWSSQNATRMEMECSGPVDISRGEIQTTSVAWEAAAIASGLYVKPAGALDGFPAAFPAASSVPEVCTFYPYGSDGTVGTAQSVTITITDSCECLVNSPFSGGSSCAGGYCDGCHCVYDNDSNCGTAANSNYACSVTETSGTLCVSGVTCYPNNGYPPSPCPTNIALTGSSAHWYCGTDQNCYANKLSSCSTGDITPLSASSYKSLWQYQMTVQDGTKRPSELGYKNMNSPYLERNIASAAVNGDITLLAEQLYNCDNTSFIENQYVTSCDYSRSDLQTFKFYLVPGATSRVSVSSSQGNGGSIFIVRYGEPPQGSYYKSDLAEDPTYFGVGEANVENTTGKDFIKVTGDGLQSIFEGSLSEDATGGWVYVRVIPNDADMQIINYSANAKYDKYKVWYDDMTANNNWDAYGDPISSSTGGTIDTSGYKSANQVEQTYCAEYDEQGYCAETVSRDLGFKNLFPPEKVANGNESTIRQGFNACNMNGGDYCDYSNQELSQFKLYLVPEMKSASVTIHNSQGNSANPTKFVAVARFGEPPTGDYSNIDPSADTISPEACTLEGATGKDCVVRNGDGITSVLNYNSGNQDVTEGGWLYVKFIELENEFRNVQSLMTVDSTKYESWYDNLTTTSQWQADGDPSETVNPANASSGSCGTAMRTYTTSETSWGNYTFCSAGTAEPASPTFPVQGSSTTWKCKGVSGGTDASCAATRNDNSSQENDEEDCHQSYDPGCNERICQDLYCLDGCDFLKGKLDCVGMQ